MPSTPSPSSERHIGDYFPQHTAFSLDESYIQELLTGEFRMLGAHLRFRKVCQSLLRSILEASEESFLLPAVVDWIEWCNAKHLLDVRLTLPIFEFWLNQFSHLDAATRRAVRGKIIGKYIPRREYQPFFPIGFNQSFAGSHFVVAHISPDVDTTIASFWGWVDAFGCGVSEGVHYWCLPDSRPDTNVKLIFNYLLSENVLYNAVRTASTLTMSAIDLVDYQKFTHAKGAVPISQLIHDHGEKSIIYVDEQGYFLGDWRSQDYEQVRQVSMMFNICMRWFESQLQSKLIELFAMQNLTVEVFPPLLTALSSTQIRDAEPVIEFLPEQRLQLHEFFRTILGLPKGLSSQLIELVRALDALSMPAFGEFYRLLTELPHSALFDNSGRLKEDRPQIFRTLHTLLNTLNSAIQSSRHYVERLEIAMQIKHKVLKHTPHYVSLETEVDELRQKMENYPSLTVVLPEKDGRLYPIGSISASGLRAKRLGTVSVRDFCNQDEMRMASYLEVISAVDHHKSSLQTSAPPTALIGDAQSANVLVAEQSFRINDRYTSAGMTLEQIDAQFSDWMAAEESPQKSRILSRLLLKKNAIARRGDYFIHPDHEFAAYMSFLYAILDDTDLLSKVTQRDLLCIVELLNRLKTLATRRECEVVDLDDLSHGDDYLEAATRRLLGHIELYSIYSKIFSIKEKEVEANLRLLIEGKESSIFRDVKEQNGCCRISQTKLFSSNFALYTAHAEEIRRHWSESAARIQSHRPHFDLHIHMMSTIPSAEEVYKSDNPPPRHKDELWIWFAEGDVAREHLKVFLNGLSSLLKKRELPVSIEIAGVDTRGAAALFEKEFPLAEVTRTSSEGPLHGVLRFRAGALNSRKTQISPYLPKLVG